MNPVCSSSKKKDKTKKNGITVLIGLIVVAIIVIAVVAVIQSTTSLSTHKPTNAAKNYVKSLLKEMDYDLVVKGAEVKYHGDLDKAKELYGSEVDNKNSIEDYCVVNVKLMTSTGDEKKYVVDCIKYNSKWKAMGVHSDYKESEDSSNSAIDNLPKINLDGETK